VEAARHLVAAATELATGVEDRVDDLEGVLARRMLADRHAAAIILDGDNAILLDGDGDLVRVAGHRLVDRVVDDLPHQVVEAPLVGRADVHPGTLPNGLEPLEDLDAGGVVVRCPPWTLAAAVGGGRTRGRGRRLRAHLCLRRGRSCCFLGHAVPPVKRS